MHILELRAKRRGETEPEITLRRRRLPLLCRRLGPRPPHPGAADPPEPELVSLEQFGVVFARLRRAALLGRRRAAL